MGPDDLTTVPCSETAFFTACFGANSSAHNGKHPFSQAKDGTNGPPRITAEVMLRGLQALARCFSSQKKIIATNTN
jgi:hypothetical protein